MRLSVIIIISLSLIVNAIIIIRPYLLKIFIDNGFDNLKMTVFLALIILGISFLLSVVQIALNKYYTGTRESIIIRLKELLLKNILGYSTEKINGFGGVGSIRTRIDDTLYFGEILHTFIFKIGINFVSLIGLIIISAGIMPYLLLFYVIIFPLIQIKTGHFTKTRRRFMDMGFEIKKKIENYLLETIIGQFIITVINPLFYKYISLF
jgi:ABC-type multidrug transport system fused ATPase/permease subunit